MSTHEANGETPTPAPGIDLGGFHWQSVDDKLNQPVEHVPEHQFHAREIDSQKVIAPAVAAALPTAPQVPPPPPLGTIKAFNGTFVGQGFNMIFRPRSNKFNDFPKPVGPSQFPADNVLELNLTRETLAFSQQLGSVPNRGLGEQDDIFLNGVTYLQLVDDITDVNTGTANVKKAANIHAEPGVWIHVPKTNVLGASLCRMGSIPHGTTINAQCFDTPVNKDGPPRIPIRDPRPFLIGTPTGTRFAFENLDVTNQTTARIPQDLSLFNANGVITDETLRDPNSVLRNHIQGQNITHSSTFTVSTNPRNIDLAGGVANIGFLRGDGDVDTTTGATIFKNANADAVQMDAQFWIETVDTTVHIPAMSAGQGDKRLVPDKGPVVVVKAPAQGQSPARDAKVTFTQIQYSQQVLLNFAPLSWPHISVATLVPQEIQL